MKYPVFLKTYMQMIDESCPLAASAAPPVLTARMLLFYGQQRVTPVGT